MLNKYTCVRLCIHMYVLGINITDRTAFFIKMNVYVFENL